MQDVKLWTSLGYLYLHNDDVELANEAFYRAQTLDPDYTLAWVGQGLVATMNGNEEDASALFEHAVSLTADLVSYQLLFARTNLTYSICSLKRTSSLPLACSGSYLLQGHRLVPRRRICFHRSLH